MSPHQKQGAFLLGDASVTDNHYQTTSIKEDDNCIERLPGFILIFESLMENVFKLKW